MMIRQSTRHGESMQKHGERGCTRCTETISMQNKEEMRLLLLRVIQVCRRRRVQQLKCREEEWCIDGHGTQSIKGRSTESARMCATSEIVKEG
jgi:hypothetical protein